MEDLDMVVHGGLGGVGVSQTDGFINLSMHGKNTGTHIQILRLGLLMEKMQL